MIPQTSEQWVPARVGKLTASRMADAMAFRKDGKPAAERVNLLHDLLAERLVGSAVDHYVTPAMQWGIEQEPFAAEAYEEETGELLLPAGLIDHPKIENFAGTPDRLLGTDGLVEIKCPTTTTFIAWRMNGTVPAAHKPQMLAQLACTRRKFVDFCAFDPRLPAGKRLFIRRYEPKPEEIEKVEAAAVEFLQTLERMFEQFTTAKVAA
jgi:exodeoxyribonuclease (lambda-induced)